MTSFYAFIGPAGSGKTYSLKAKLNELCEGQEFQEYQKILAITFMHGSRRRLATKLGKHVGKHVPVLCETIDSFCLRLVNRYRCRMQRSKIIAIDNSHDDWIESDSCFRTSFNTVRSTTVALLEDSDVRKAVAAAYPIVLIDEFQDCDDDLLKIVQQLSKTSVVLVGADDFQYLKSSEESPAVEWLRSVKCELNELCGNHRTDSPRLLSSAIALREATVATSSIDVIPRADKNGGLIAFEIAKQISWGNLQKKTSRVLITPAGPDSSPWVKGIMVSLKKSLAKGKLSPAPFHWEDSNREKCEKAISVAADAADSQCHCSKTALQQMTGSTDPILRMAGGRALRLISLRGARSISSCELRQLIELSSHSIGAFGSENRLAQLAMTVHGAKNREFDYVFIAWPYQVPDCSVRKRKLLYNAITRARLGAFLFVQGSETRVKNDSVLRLLECGIVADVRPTNKMKKK